MTTENCTLCGIYTTEFNTNMENVTSQSDDTATSGLLWLPNYWSGFIEKPTSQQVTLFGTWIRLLGLPPVFVFGIFGNILAIAVMLRPVMRRHSYSYYLILCAVCDSVSLLVRILFWVNLLREFYHLPVLIRFLSVAECIASEYVITANTTICSWAIVCITVERVIVVLFPLTGTRVCNVSTARKIVVCVAVAPFIMLCYIPVFTKYLPSVGCAMEFSNTMIHFVIATVIISMLPLVIIFVGNACIIVQLRRQENVISGTGNRSQKSNRVNMMMVTVSLTFFVLVMPNALLVLIGVLRPDWTSLEVLRDPAAFLWDINFAINFYLYIATAKNVRIQLMLMFTRKTSALFTVSSTSTN